MRNKIIILLSFIFLLNISIIYDLRSETKNASPGIHKAQGTRANAGAVENKTDRDISEDKGVIFTVMLITLVTWTALSVYIYHLNRKVKKLEKKLDEKKL